MYTHAATTIITAFYDFKIATIWLRQKCIESRRNSTCGVREFIKKHVVINLLPVLLYGKRTHSSSVSKGMYRLSNILLATVAECW